MRRSLSTLPLVLLAAGCAPAGGDDRFPSLLPRPIESRDDAEHVPQPVAPTPDPALDARIAEIGDAIELSGVAFEAAYQSARPLAQAARGADPGSTAWLDAQVALAELDVARTDTRLRLAELERLAIDRALELQPAYPTLTALIGTAEAQLQRQDEQIAAIEALLAPV